MLCATTNVFVFGENMCIHVHVKIALQYKPRSLLQVYFCRCTLVFVHALLALVDKRQAIKNLLVVKHMTVTCPITCCLLERHY